MNDRPLLHLTVRLLNENYKGYQEQHYVLFHYYGHRITDFHDCVARFFATAKRLGSTATVPEVLHSLHGATRSAVMRSSGGVPLVTFLLTDSQDAKQYVLPFDDAQTS